MKDAKGHGSNKRDGGAAHQEGVESATKPQYLSVQRMRDEAGNPQTGAMGRKWIAQHDPTGQSLGDLAFKSRKEGQDFLAEHLDPTNAKWKESPAAMHDHYRAARAKLYNIR